MKSSFDKLFYSTISREKKSYDHINNDQLTRKIAINKHNPNAIYKVVKVESPSGYPIYTLVNTSCKNDIIDMNLKTVQDAVLYAMQNGLNMEKDG